VIVRRSSAIAEGLHDVLSVKILPKAAQLYTKIPFEKPCNRRVTMKVIQGHKNSRYSIGHTSLHISGL